MLPSIQTVPQSGSQCLIRHCDGVDASVRVKHQCSCGVLSPPYISLIYEFEHVFNSGFKNFEKCRRPVKTSLNISAWRTLLVDYEDTMLCDMLEFGFPLDIQGVVPVTTDFRAHKGARDYPAHLDQYLQTEKGLGRMAGPFANEPLSVPLHVSPINSVPKGRC